MVSDSGERMARIETDIQYIKQSVDELKTVMKDFDNRYASKTVERIVYGGVSIALITIAGAVIYVIAIHPSSLTGG